MGAQHLTKKKVLSSEIGAVGTGAYQTKWADLLKVSPGLELDF